MQFFTTEAEGQAAFFQNYLDKNIDEVITADSTDGVYNGILFEFKLRIENPNSTLFQAIKYLSKMRIKGKSIPATILLVSLNEQKAYQYTSADYFDQIHTIYTGAASKDNLNFFAKNPIKIFDYSSQLHSSELRNLMIRQKDKAEQFMPINIDENCIVGWALRYYSENPKANKGDFLGDFKGSKSKVIGEIREPKHFKYEINPYTKATNEKFKYLMDCLNDRLSKKDLGAFYTPSLYALKAAQLVKMAVDRVPQGNDYIILDRCAGTGNLQSALKDLKDKNGDLLLSHCVVSTYEYYEYKVLNERIGDLVRAIIPPSEKDVSFASGKVVNADAMSQEFLNNPIIKQYIDNDKCSIILFENPPFSEVAGVAKTFDKMERKKANSWKNSYIAQQMKREIKSSKITKGLATNDLANLFIWSGFKYYLRQSTDSYILFSPIKYWKNQGLANKENAGIFIFNRSYFHASPSAITCSLWYNIDKSQEILNAQIVDISINQQENILGHLDIKKTHKLLSEAYDKRNFDDDVNDGIACGYDGYESTSSVLRIDKKFNLNILGYLVASVASFENPRLTAGLTRCGRYTGNGFFLRQDNYLQKLPLFTAAKYPIEDNWFEFGIIFKSLDNGENFINDRDFLKSCLIFTALSYYNKCLSLTGSDGRFYKNELCFDENTIASKDLAKMNLNADDKELLDIWQSVLNEAKKTKDYKADLSYGVYQITKELNTFKQYKQGNKTIKEFDYPQLNGNLSTLKEKLKQYYKKHITPKLFKYELLK